MTTSEVVLESAAGEPLVTLTRRFLPRPVAEAVEATLEAERDAFRNGFMLVGDRWVKTPRLVAEFGDEEFSFPDTLPNDPWPLGLVPLREAIEDHLATTFNYGLANWYRDGDDFTGWHSDKMAVHVPGSVIAMFSIGADRELRFRDASTSTVRASIVLTHGSLLVMTAGSQDGLEHAVPRASVPTGRRISVTFRRLLPTSGPHGTVTTDR